MIRFFKSLFGSKKVEESAAPYKVESVVSEPPATAPATAVVEGAGKVEIPAPAPKAKKAGSKKPANKKPKAPKAKKPKAD